MLGIGIGVRVNGARRIQRGRIEFDPRVSVRRGGCGRQPVARHHEAGAAQVADLADLLATRQAMADLDQRALGVAEDEQIGLGIGQYRAAHGVGPVVIVGDAAQARLDRADDHRDAGVGLTAALGVHGDRTVGALVGFGMRGIGIVGAQLAVGGVAVDHRVHVAGGDAEIQRRPAERAKRLGRVPVGLADDADAKTLCLQQAADQRHAEAWMVDVGVARHQDDVAGVPAERGHLGARHRQEGRGAEACRPVLAIGEERGGHYTILPLPGNPPSSH